MKHEEAARQVYPEAFDFRPVRNGLRVVIGWTFEIPGLEEYGWVTVEGEPSGDHLATRTAAGKSLKAYRSVRRAEPVDIMGKRA